jgi:hypothetical protein
VTAGRSLAFSLLLAPFALAACGILRGDSPALPPGTQECIGMEPAVCALVLGDMAGDHPGFRPVAWSIRCVTTCTANEGDVEMTVTWSDGSTEVAGKAWAGGIGPRAGPGVGPPEPVGPIPTPPVPPTCLGVPQQQCVEEWLGSLASVRAVQRDHVTAVRIQCTTTCNALKGDGTTTVILDGGSTTLSTGWSYGSQP